MNLSHIFFDKKNILSSSVLMIVSLLLVSPLISPFQVYNATAAVYSDKSTFWPQDTTGRGCLTPWFLTHFLPTIHIASLLSFTVPVPLSAYFFTDWLTTFNISSLRSSVSFANIARTGAAVPCTKLV